MQYTIVKYLTIAAFLCGPLFSAQADVVLFDDFDGVNLDPAVWTEMPQNASGLDKNISGSKLVVEDISDPWVINNASGGTWSIVTLYSHNFNPSLSDFTIEFQFSWSADDPQTGEQNVRAMQGIYIQAYDTEGAQIARAGYFDFWINYQGGRTGKISGGDEVNAAQHRLESLGSATINISRTGNDVVVTWDGEQLMMGTNAEPLQSIGILFYYYPFDGVGGPSFFGTESVDLVQVAETADDITTTTTTTTSCAFEPCGNRCCLQDEYCCNGECCSLGRVCCEDGHCCDPDSICCGGGCCYKGYLCVFGTCITIGCPFSPLYGKDSEEVALLRKYRDEVLSTTLVGQEIIRLYYLWSPAIVKAMEEDEAFKKEVKELIDGLLPLIREEVE